MQKGFLIAGILHVYVPGKPSTVLKSWWMSFAGTGHPAGPGMGVAAEM